MTYNLLVIWLGWTLSLEFTIDTTFNHHAGTSGPKRPGRFRSDDQKFSRPGPRTTKFGPIKFGP